MTPRQRAAIAFPCALATDVLQDGRFYDRIGRWSTILSVNK